MSIRDETAPPSRRDFCALACQAASLAAAGTLIQACGGNPNAPGGSAPQLSSVSATVTGRVVSIAIPSSGALASAGTGAITSTAIGSFLIARTGDASFTVLTATCTHEACTVSGFASSEFVCPCHGSRFSTSGAVVTGPASRALATFPSSFANGTLTFTA